MERKGVPAREVVLYLTKLREIEKCHWILLEDASKPLNSEKLALFNSQLQLLYNNDTVAFVRLDIDDVPGISTVLEKLRADVELGLKVRTAIGKGEKHRGSTGDAAGTGIRADERGGIGFVSLSLSLLSCLLSGCSFNVLLSRAYLSRRQKNGTDSFADVHRYYASSSSAFKNLSAIETLRYVARESRVTDFLYTLLKETLPPHARYLKDEAIRLRLPPITPFGASSTIYFMYMWSAALRREYHLRDARFTTAMLFGAVGGMIRGKADLILAAIDGGRGFVIENGRGVLMMFDGAKSLHGTAFPYCTTLFPKEEREGGKKKEQGDGEEEDDLPPLTEIDGEGEFFDGWAELLAAGLGVEEQEPQEKVRSFSFPPLFSPFSSLPPDTYPVIQQILPVPSSIPLAAQGNHPTAVVPSPPSLRDSPSIPSPNASSSTHLPHQLPLETLIGFDFVQDEGKEFELGGKVGTRELKRRNGAFRVCEVFKGAVVDRQELKALTMKLPKGLGSAGRFECVFLPFSPFFPELFRQF
jgi:hypothetical protein